MAPWAWGEADSIAIDAKLSVAIDLSIWSLQLPVGTGTSPAIISPQQLLAGFSNDYFYQAADGGRVFMDSGHRRDHLGVCYIVEPNCAR